MKNMMFLVILTVSISVFGRQPMFDCGDRVNNSVSHLSVLEAASRLEKTAAEGNNQQAMILRLGLITGEANPLLYKKYAQYLAHLTLANDYRPLAIVKEECDRAYARDVIVEAEGIILELRKQVGLTAQ